MARANAFAEILPPSTSASSSTPTKKVRYDVFINHRGPDTKKTLAESIYRALKLMGLEVFLDEAELELGDSIPSEIQEAMKSSFLHIAIFSPRYAESPWCLAELSYMLNTEKPIVPVFCNVDPSDIHWICKGKGSYAKALSEHEANARYPSQTLEDWKVALEKVSYAKGHIVKNEHDKEVLKIIANYVLKCSKKIPFVVAKHPVGLVETLQDFKKNVFESSGSVKIVGIIGMGGCGKTTLAKEYYNNMIQFFYRCSFVCDIRDIPTKNLYEKQKKMFQDLGGSKDISFDSVEEGKAILAEYLRFVQVFIILDDVDHLDQLDSLLPIKDNLTQDSVIVVTSRDSGILISWGIPSSSIYTMKELNPKHAMQLFCWHVFQQPYPVSEFEYLVDKFLIVCKGLPLAIKVLGGLVHGKSKEYWNGQLEKISSSLHKDIKNILLVSFDALDEEEKEIFLDISCFFIGTERYSAITVWEESRWSGAASLGTLIDKCLVEVDKENYLRMHDLLRDLGKEISKTWSPYRLWSPQQITHIIEKQGEESVLIRGIKAQTDEFCDEFTELVRESGRGIKRKRAFKILDVESNYFTEELSTLSEGFVSLRWVYFPHTVLPSWISLKKLRVLELREASKLEQPWSENVDPPVQLRVLKIIHAESFQRFPRSIGFLKHLQKISFDGKGAPIEGLPDEFCHLQSLERLELVRCDKLKSLPSKFGDLANLQYLYLRECSGIEGLPEEFGHLQSLERLEIRGCDKLKLLPGKFSDLTNLRRLEIQGCNGLMIQAETLAQLASLHFLSIYGCPGLTELVIQPGCSSSSFCSLDSIHLGECPVSRISISPQCCPILDFLFLADNHDIVEIDSWPISVKYVHLARCWNLESISFTSGLPKIKDLYIGECDKLRKIEGLENCRLLETLQAHTWRKVQLIQSLKDMESLRGINLTAACDISAFEPCLQTINREKWPSGCIICGRTGPGVEAIVKSFTIPGLTLDDTFVWDADLLGFVFSKELSSNDAALVCLVINPPSDHITVQVSAVELGDAHTYVKQGKWVYIAVFTQSNFAPRKVPFWLSDDGPDNPGPSKVDIVEMGMLAMGKLKNVVDAFFELLQRLGKIGDICEDQ